MRGAMFLDNEAVPSLSRQLARWLRGGVESSLAFVLCQRHAVIVARAVRFDYPYNPDVAAIEKKS
jgi:hypothetical protein